MLPVSANELWTAFSTEDQKHRWEWSGSGVPHSYCGGLPIISFDWVLYECTQANLLQLEKQGVTFVVTKTADGGLDSFSFAGTSPRTSGLHHYITIYGCRHASRSVSSPRGLMLHARYWLEPSRVNDMAYAVFVWDGFDVTSAADQVAALRQGVGGMFDTELPFYQGSQLGLERLF